MSSVISPSLGLSPARPFPDDCLAKFKPERELASGGYGAVYLARQESLDRLVAVKLLLGHVLKDAAQIQRFIAEARITASLKHPHVVTVIDHGAEYRVPWIAYEYLPGPSLRARLSNGSLAPREAAIAAMQVAEALDAAHALDVLHRDVKPDNVLTASPGHYKVADFGIARWTDDARVNTGTGLILGTPAYIAPEQVKGQPASPSSDIYALGVMLFELVTATLPFDTANPLKMLEMQVSDAPPLPSERNAAVPPELERIILRALAKQPEERFASAREMADTLAAFIAAPEEPAGLGSGRVRRPPGRSAGQRETLQTRPLSGAHAPGSVAPGGAAQVQEPATAAGLRRAAVAVGAAVFVAGAALALALRGMPPIGIPSPGPTATGAVIKESVAAPPASPRAPSKVVEMREWLPPLLADLEELIRKPPARVVELRIRQILDGIWARVDAQTARKLPDRVLAITCRDLGWRNDAIREHRGAMLKNKQPEAMRALEQEYAVSLEHGRVVMAACLERQPLPFAVLVEAGLQYAQLAHDRCLVIDKGGPAKVRRQVQAWAAQYPGHPLLALTTAAIASAGDAPRPELWTGVLAWAEREGLPREATGSDAIAWYALLRYAISHSGGRDLAHVSRVVAIEERVRARGGELQKKVKERDAFYEQVGSARTGLSELDN